MFGIPDDGSNGFGVSPSTVKKKVVGLFGSFGSSGVSEKNNFRTRTGFTSRNQVVEGSGSGVGFFGKLDCGSGASAFATISAIARVGSFSPIAPVFTPRVTSDAFDPVAGPSTTNSIRPPGGTPRWFNRIEWLCGKSLL